VSAQLRGGERLDIERVGATSADGASAFAASLAGHLGGAFAQLRAYRKERELAGAPYGAVPGDDTNRNVDEMILAEGGYTRELGRVTLTGRAYLGATASATSSPTTARRSSATSATRRGSAPRRAPASPSGRSASPPGPR